MFEDKNNITQEHRVQRTMKVPVLDQSGLIYAMLQDHKEATNSSLKESKQDIITMCEIATLEESTLAMTQLNTKIYGLVNPKIKYLSKTAFNKTFRNTVGEPVKEFKKRFWKGKAVRTPRFRRLSVRYDHATSKVDLAARTISLAFRSEQKGAYIPKGKRTWFVDFTLGGSLRYADRFKGMDHVSTYLNFKNGKVWASLVFAKDVRCKDPSMFLGLDAGMYKNTNVFYPYIGGKTLKAISSDLEPKLAAKKLVRIAKKVNAAIVIESLTSLTRLTSGLRNVLPLSKYFKALKLECQDNAVVFIDINPAYTSMFHATCGNKIIREKTKEGWSKGYCPTCDEELHADENAAINIARKGFLVYEEYKNG